MAVTAQQRATVRERRAQMEAIVAEHETALLRYATRILRNAGAAQDVVQNVFIKLMRAWKKGTRPSAGLKAWLYRATHNEAVDHIRRESRLRLLHEKQHEHAMLGCSDGHHCDLGESERRELVLARMHLLDASEQQVLLLRLEEGLSYKEISAVIGRPIGSVSSTLHYAVRKLAASLKRDGVIGDAARGRP